jgi:hypothetical protein
MSFIPARGTETIGSASAVQRHQRGTGKNRYNCLPGKDRG